MAIIHALMLQTRALHLVFLRKVFFHPSERVYSKFLNFILSVFSTNSNVSFTTLGLPSKVCSLMLRHPTLSRSSPLAFSCVRQSSRKCLTVSMPCPHVQFGSSATLARCKYWFSLQ